MQLSKKTFYFSLLISLLSLSLSIFFTFFCIENSIINFINNIIMNIFAGTIILMITSLFDYYIQKRNFQREIITMLLKYRTLFNNLTYLKEIERFPSYKEYFVLSLLFNGECTEEEFHNQEKLLQDKTKDIVEKIMIEYNNIVDNDFREYLLLYDNLYFLLDFKSKKRKWYKDEIFFYLISITDQLKEKLNYINKYKNNFYLYTDFAYQIILDMQKDIFFYEESGSENKRFNKEFSFDSIVELGKKDYDHDYIIANKVVDRIDNVLKQLRK